MQQWKCKRWCYRVRCLFCLILNCFLIDIFFFYRYTFSSVFGPNVDQKKFFDTWVYDKVLRFLNGNNELLFAYGTTNAGKTYTIHGN